MPAETARAKNMGKLYILLSAFFWSFSGVGIKYVDWNPVALTGWRSLFAAILIFGIVKIGSRKSGGFKLKINKITLLSAAATFMSLFLFVAATKLTTSANAIVLHYSAPIYVVLYQLIFQKRRPLGIDMVALIIMMAGISLFFLDGLSLEGLLGIIIGIINAMFVGAFYWINTMPQADPMSSSIMAHAAAAIVGMPFIFLPGNSVNPQSFLVIFLLGTLQLGLGYFFFSKGIVNTPAIDALLISMIEPILTPVWVMLVVNEVPGPLALVGAGVVMLAVLCWNLLKVRAAALQQKREQKPPSQQPKGASL